MDNKKGSRSSKNANAILKVIEKVAERKALALCIGLLYEPEVPKKLQK